MSQKKPRSTPFSEESIQECLRILRSGDVEDLFEIIPRIGVLRDSRFSDPLHALLRGRDLKRRQFAAYAMGAMRDREFLEPLKQAFEEAGKLSGVGAEDLMIAIIEAIGALGDDAAVHFFLPMLQGGASAPVSGQLAQWIVESLGAIAQQGGARSVDALLALTRHERHELRAQALSELSVAYWHRPNDIGEEILRRIYELTQDSNPLVAESALSALQSLADVGCRRAEEFFES